MQKRSVKYLSRKYKAMEARGVVMSVRGLINAYKFTGETHFLRLAQLRLFDATQRVTKMLNEISEGNPARDALTDVIVTEMCGGDGKTMYKETLSGDAEKINIKMEYSGVVCLNPEEPGDPNSYGVLAYQKVAPLCHMCGGQVDETDVCARCDQFVCFECCAHGDGVTCTIEETRCKDCHENYMHG